MSSTFSRLANSPSLANGGVYVLVLVACLAVQSLLCRLADLSRLSRKKTIMASETTAAAEKAAPKHSGVALAWHRFALRHDLKPPPSEIGTSLGTFESVQLCVLLLINALLMFLPVEWPVNGDSPWGLSDIANRCAWVGLGNAFFIFITATRSSILTLLTGLPFERNLLYHRWFGYLIALQVTLHVILQFVYISGFGELANQMSIKVNIYGAVGWASLVLLTSFSLPIFRRRFYQLFKYSHFLFLLFVIFGCLHVPSMAWFIGLGVGLWVVDRVLRFWRSRQDVEVLDLVPLQAGEQSAAAIKVVLKVGQGKPRHFEAGQYAFITAPRLATYLNYHPITVMASPDLVGTSGVAHLLEENFTSPYRRTDGTTPDGTIVSFCIKVFGGFSGDLYKAASAGKEMAAADGKGKDVPTGERDVEAAGSKVPRSLQLWSVDGFYGSALVDFADYPVIALLGGGIGITPMISIVGDLAARMCLPLRIPRTDGQPVPTLALAAKDVYFFWWTNSVEQYDWLRKEMNWILRLAREGEQHGNRIHVTVIVTDQKAFDLEQAGYNELERGAITFAVKWQQEVLQGIKSKHPVGDCAVAVCGPARMVRETRNVCAGSQVSNESGKFDVHWESFEY